MRRTGASGSLAVSAAMAPSSALASASAASSFTIGAVGEATPSARASASALAASAAALAPPLAASATFFLSAMTLSCSFLRSTAGMVAASSSLSSSAASAVNAVPESPSAFAKRSPRVAASANAASAFAYVTPSTRRTPRPRPSSVSRANFWTSDELLMCVPPQNSDEYCDHSASAGASIICCTPGPPTATTRTGSGYCSPKTARRPLIWRALSSALIWICTGSEAAICAFTRSCTSCNSASVSGLPYAKSKRSLSASHSEPRWSHAVPRAFMMAWLSMCVAVWFFAIGARRP
mmetsp:Transcript_24074/g.61500  ORF Transcript_24074/g.61500 Transcript_24074/m.61500 type:complete len:293 (-) Transcript_24074:2256-3134(-)